MVIVAETVPAGSCDTFVGVTVIVSGCCLGARLSLSLEIVNQGGNDAWSIDQLSVASPVLVMVKFCGPGLVPCVVVKVKLLGCTLMIATGLTVSVTITCSVMVPVAVL